MLKNFDHVTVLGARQRHVQKMLILQSPQTARAAANRAEGHIVPFLAVGKNRRCFQGKT